jgi:hypothetical protein
MSVDNRSRWTPVLRGENYCSPVCGFGCKKSEYDAAVAASETLAAHMGAGWRGRVWENLGWHYEAVKGACNVRPHGTGAEVYSAVLDTSPQFFARSASAVDAVADVLQQAREHLERTTRQIEQVIQQVTA